MTPRERAREIAFEQICFWAVRGLTYENMLDAISFRARGFRSKPDRDFVVKALARVWLRLEAA